MTKLTFMSVEMSVASQEEILSAVEEATTQHPVQIATVNPEFILEAQRNQAFRQSLKEMTYCVIDGVGLLWWIKFWLQKRGQLFSLERYPGATLVQDLFHRYHQGEKSFYFLGGSEGAMEKARHNLQTLFPKLNIKGIASGGRFTKDQIIVDPQLLTNIQAKKPDILLIGFGAPKQELWMQITKNQLVVPVMIGIGGTLNFYSSKKRAPRWMQSWGLEWFFRVLTEPGHWRRAWRTVVVFSWSAFWWIQKRESRFEESILKSP